MLIVELVIPPCNAPFFGNLLDLHMLVLLTGRERTEPEYRDLPASAGFHSGALFQPDPGPVSWKPCSHSHNPV